MARIDQLPSVASGLSGDLLPIARYADSVWTDYSLSFGNLTDPVYTPAGVSITGGSVDNTAIGANTAASGAFTTLTTTGAATLAGSVTLGAAMSVAGALNVAGSVSGNGFTAIFASPPSIGTTAPAAGDFTSLSATGAATLSGGIVGTTAGGNASTGNVGEYLTVDVASGSAVSLTTTTIANVATLSLTAGDWDVSGVVGFSAAGSTTVTLVEAGINTTSATMPLASSGLPAASLSGSLTTGTAQVLSLAQGRVNVSSTTTLYLVAGSTFATSTMGAYGFMGARRVR